jgi:hypothetical protein
MPRSTRNLRTRSPTSASMGVRTPAGARHPLARGGSRARAMPVRWPVQACSRTVARSGRWSPDATRQCDRQPPARKTPDLFGTDRTRHEAENESTVGSGCIGERTEGVWRGTMRSNNAVPGIPLSTQPLRHATLAVVRPLADPGWPKYSLRVYAHGTVAPMARLHLAIAPRDCTSRPHRATIPAIVPGMTST